MFSVTEVAYEFGFSSPQYFGTVFRRVFGGLTRDLQFQIRNGSQQMRIQTVEGIDR